MKLSLDHEGAVDLTSHNWSVGGQTQHVDVRYYFTGD